MSIMELMMLEAGMQNFLEMLTDPSKPAKARLKMLIDAVQAHHGDLDLLLKVFGPLLAHAAEQHEIVAAAQVKTKYEEALQELTDGPLRVATFICVVAARFGHAKLRAHVVSSDGQRRPVVIADHVAHEELKPGATVYLDAKGAVLLDVADDLPETGQVAKFLRLLPGGKSIEAVFHEEPLVLNASYELIELAAAGGLAHGDLVTFCPQRQFAFKKLPARDDRKHRFIDASKLQPVVASRDIGNPHWILSHLLFRLHVMLHRPELMQQFHLRPRFSAMFVGPSGVGKTLTIQAFLYEFDQALRDYTGRADLGSRVIRVKSAGLLSEWLGRSDANIDELFADVIHLASQEHTLADGRRVRLPVVLLLEEVEALGKRRGSDYGDVYDRILGMLLQRLDDPTDSLASLPIFILSSSNRPELIDSALIRRLGGVKALFRRLDRVGFAAVLGKKIWPGFPCASQNGTPQAALRERLIQQTTALLFSPNGDDHGQVEITLRDGTKLVKHRRDFLTGAVVEQAVANAVDRIAYDAARSGSQECGLDVAELIQSLYNVVDSLVDNLTAFNAHDYVDLPEQAAIGHIRRLPQTGARLTDLLN